MGVGVGLGTGAVLTGAGVGLAGAGAGFEVVLGPAVVGCLTGSVGLGFTPSAWATSVSVGTTPYCIYPAAW